jgi:hypothetical protein
MSNNNFSNKLSQLLDLCIEHNFDETFAVAFAKQAAKERGSNEPAIPAPDKSTTNSDKVMFTAKAKFPRKSCDKCGAFIAANEPTFFVPKEKSSTGKAQGWHKACGSAEDMKSIRTAPIAVKAAPAAKGWEDSEAVLIAAMNATINPPIVYEEDILDLGGSRISMEN